jgi:polysaccharide pyruvyl transferase WcaK-like protein
MPQSLHYDSEVLQYQEAIQLQSGVAVGLARAENLQLGSNSNETGKLAEQFLNTSVGRALASSRVSLAWREHESYELALKLYPFANNVLSPDIAFQLGPYQALPPSSEGPKSQSNTQVDFVLFLRDDKESVLAKFRNSSSIRRLLKPLGKKSGGARRRYTFQIVDWNDRLGRFVSPSGHSRDFLNTETAIRLLSLGRVVICDRLHASILAYLSGLPFVYIDQKTAKITKGLQVAFESDPICQDRAKAMWESAETLESALSIAADFLDRYRLNDALITQDHARDLQLATNLSIISKH